AELAQHLGDVIAHEAGRRLRQGFRWGQQTHRILLTNLAEYVTEESRLLPPRAELEARLLEPLPQLEESLDELEQRIQQLERRLRHPWTSHQPAGSNLVHRLRRVLKLAWGVSKYRVDEFIPLAPLPLLLRLLLWLAPGHLFPRPDLPRGERLRRALEEL